MDITWHCRARGMRSDAVVVWERTGFVRMGIVASDGAIREVRGTSPLIIEGHPTGTNPGFERAARRAAQIACSHFMKLGIADRVRMFGDDWRSPNNHMPVGGIGLRTWAVWGYPCDRWTFDYVDSLNMLDFMEGDDDPTANPNLVVIDPMTGLRVVL